MLICIIWFWIIYKKIIRKFIWISLIVVRHPLIRGYQQAASLCLVRVTNDLTGSFTHLSLDKMATISQTTFSSAVFFSQKVRISIEMSLKFVLEGPINNIRTLVQIMACRRPSHYLNQCRPSSPTHICGTSGGWVNLCRWETQPSSSDANVHYVFNHCCVCSSFSGGLHVSGQIWS